MHFSDIRTNHCHYFSTFKHLNTVNLLWFLCVWSCVIHKTLPKNINGAWSLQAAFEREENSTSSSWVCPLDHLSNFNWFHIFIKYLPAKSLWSYFFTVKMLHLEYRLYNINIYIYIYGVSYQSYIWNDRRVWQLVQIQYFTFVLCKTVCIMHVTKSRLHHFLINPVHLTAQILLNTMWQQTLQNSIALWFY